MCGHHVALSIETFADGTVQAGFSVATVSMHEFIYSEEVQIALVSDKNNTYNCWWHVPHGVLPIIEFGLNRTAAAGFKFHPVMQGESPARAMVSFRDSVFELDLRNKQYRTDNNPQPVPEYFPKKEAAKYDREIRKKKPSNADK